MILKRYILIFTLALISCAGTNYIHSISTDESDEQERQLSEDHIVIYDLKSDNTYVEIN